MLSIRPGLSRLLIALGLIGLVLTGLLVGLLVPRSVSAPTTTPSPSPSPAGCPRFLDGDVNGDGYADVAVGSPWAKGGRGTIHLFYGYRGNLVSTPTGTALDDVEISQDSPGVPDQAAPDNRFGDSIVTADFNADGCADLAVGAPGQSTYAGSVTIFYGSQAGLHTQGSTTLTFDSVLGAGSAVGDGFFGNTLATGDLDHDGVADLVTDTSTSTATPTGDAPRSVVVVYGAAGGLGSGRPGTRISAGTLGLTTEWRGSGLAVGDFDGNGRDEIAVGGARRNPEIADDDPASDGGVYVLGLRDGAYGVEGGIFTSTPGFPGDKDEFQQLGSRLAVGDVQADGIDDLVLADPESKEGTYETETGRGVLVLLLGSPTGLTTQGSQYWNQDAPGVDGSWDYGNSFGRSIAFGHVDAGPTADLVVGSPGSGIGGGVVVLLGGPNGLSTDEIGGTEYTQATPGVSGTSERADCFGCSVALAQLDGPGPAALIVGTPGEDTGAIADAGAITQFGISSGGPTGSTSQTLTLDSPGVAGQAFADDGFGGTFS